MNTLGRLFRISILGESHGFGVGVLIDGCPAGLALSAEDFTHDLKRRQGGQGRGTTPRKESDYPDIRSGVFEGHTTGAPLLIIFENENKRSADYDKLKNTPRPGHADLVAKQKYGAFNDYRGGGHFSGRLTAGLVAAGVIAKKLMPDLEIKSELCSVGGSQDIEAAIDDVLASGDSVGGVVAASVKGIPVGLGEPFFDSLESQLSHAIFAIPAIKGVEFGAGFDAARLKGSEMNDDILDAQGRTATNNAGGINGGISNGNELLLKVAVKPTSSIKKEKQTVNLEDESSVPISVAGRHDACIALRVPVVLEAVIAIVLCDFMLLENKLSRVIGA